MNKVRNSDLMQYLKQIEELVRSMNNSSTLDQISAKIDDIYFENEMVKHNLYLDQELRSIKDELKALKHKIRSKIQEIDHLIKTITLN